MKIKGVIFDMDGTLTDSERYARDLTLSLFAEKGYPISEQFYNRLIGTNRDSGIRILYEKTKDDEISDYLFKLYAIRMNEAFNKSEINLKKGAVEIIDFLHLHNIPAALATSANMTKVKASFNSNNMNVPFDHIVTGDMVKNGKPDPEIFIKAANLIGVDIKDCLVIEDSIHGIDAALACESIVVMVPDLLEPTEEQLKQGVIVKKDLFEVLDFIKQHVNL